MDTIEALKNDAKVEKVKMWLKIVRINRIVFSSIHKVKRIIINTLFSLGKFAEYKAFKGKMFL